jgi:hypothetical protein
MCRNIRTLHNFEPPATAEEISAAALQYVRKISGYQKVPKANQETFDAAVAEISRITSELLESLVATGEPKDRDAEKARAKERWKKREARMRGS